MKTIIIILVFISTVAVMAAIQYKTMYNNVVYNARYVRIHLTNCVGNKLSLAGPTVSSANPKILGGIKSSSDGMSGVVTEYVAYQETEVSVIKDNVAVKTVTLLPGDNITIDGSSIR